MNTLQYDYSRLSFVAYASIPDLSKSASIASALLDQGIPPGLFSNTNSDEPWKIVEQFSDSSSGLSVTLFKNQPADAASPAKFCIAVRGTDNGPDYVNDLALALGAPTAQFDVLKAKVSQWFEAPSGVLHQQQVDACGHSLGGFLALSLKPALGGAKFV